MMAVNHVGCEWHALDPVDHRHAVIEQLAGQWSWMRRIDGDFVASASYTQRQITDDDLGARAMVELDVGEEDLHRSSSAR